MLKRKSLGIGKLGEGLRSLPGHRSGDHQALQSVKRRAATSINSSCLRLLKCLFLIIVRHSFLNVTTVSVDSLGIITGIKTHMMTKVRHN